MKPITTQTVIKASAEDIWKFWTSPACIMQWNNPTNAWHTPNVEIDLKDGGYFSFRMETKNGGHGFDHVGIYNKVIPNELIEYTVADGRKSIIKFTTDGKDTIVTEIFEPETETDIEEQKNFCQAILDNFKRYAENEKRVTV